MALAAMAGAALRVMGGRPLSEIYGKSWYEFHAPLFTAPGEQPQPDYYADHLQLVPVQLVVLAPVASIATTNQAIDTGRVAGGAAIYPFVQNLILGIRAEGLGISLTTVLVPVEDEVKQLLQIPCGHHVAAHLRVGWPERPLPTGCPAARSKISPPSTTSEAPHSAGSDTTRKGEARAKASSRGRTSAISSGLIPA